MKKSWCVMLILLSAILVPTTMPTTQRDKNFVAASRALNEIWSDRIYASTAGADCEPTEYRIAHQESLTKRSHEVYCLLSPHTIFNGSPWRVDGALILNYNPSVGGQAIVLRYTLPKVPQEWTLAALNIYWINSTYKIGGIDNVRFIVYYNASNITTPTGVTWKSVYEGSEAWFSTNITYVGWYTYPLAYANRWINSNNSMYLWIRIEVSNTSGTNYNATVGRQASDAKSDPAEWVYAGSYNVYSYDFGVEVLLTTTEYASDYYQFIDLKFANTNNRMHSYMRMFPRIPVANESSRWLGLELLYKFAYGSLNDINSANNTGVMYIKKQTSAGSFYDASWDPRYFWTWDFILGKNDTDFLIAHEERELSENNSRIIEFMAHFGNNTELNVTVLQPIKMEIESKHYYNSSSPYPYYRAYVFPAEVTGENYGFSNNIQTWATLYLADEDRLSPRIYMPPLINEGMATTYYENGSLVGAIYSIYPGTRPSILVFAREPINESGIQFVKVEFIRGFTGYKESAYSLLPLQNGSWEYTTYKVILDTTLEAGEIVLYNVSVVDYAQNEITDTNNGSMYAFSIINPSQSRVYELPGGKYSLNASVIGATQFAVSATDNWFMILTKTNSTLKSELLGVAGRRLTQFTTFSINVNTTISISFEIPINLKELEQNFYDLSSLQVYIRNFYSPSWIEAGKVAEIDRNKGVIRVSITGKFRCEFAVVIFRYPDPIAETVSISGLLILALFGFILLYRKITRTEKHWEWGVIRYGTPF